MFYRHFIMAIGLGMATLMATTVSAQIHPQLTGPELLDALHDDYKPATVPDYGRRPGHPLHRNLQPP